jgi:hypothetical protein
VIPELWKNHLLSSQQLSLDLSFRPRQALYM